MQWARWIRYILLLFAFMIGVLLTAFAYLFWGYSYDAFTKIVLETVDKVDWTSYFQESVFPLTKFHITRYVLLGLLLLYIPFGVFFYLQSKNWANYIVNSFNHFYQSFLESFGALSRREWRWFWVIFGLFILRSLFHMSYYEIDYDEAWTYNHFSSKGILVDMISPNNNHILYSIFSSLFDYLPLPTKYAIRLPAFLSVALLLSVFFSFVNKKHGYTAALIGLSILAFSPSINAYAFLARGYGFMMLFTFMAYIALDGLCQNNSKKNYYIGLYICSTILGVYSNLAFLLLGIPLLGVLWLRYLMKEIAQVKFRTFFISNSIIFIVLLLLHLPLLLSNGLDVLGTASSTAISEESIIGADFWYYLQRVVDWLLYGQKALLLPVWMAFIFVFLIAAIYSKKHRSNYWALWIATLLLSMPFWWMLLTHIQVPYRLWSGLAIFLALGWGIVISLIVKKGEWIAIALGCLFAVVSERHYFLNWSAALDWEAKKIATILLEVDSKIVECYSFSRYDKPLLTYYFTIGHRPFKCWMPFEESKDYQPFEKREYEAVLLDVDDYSPTKQDLETLKVYPYQLVYENHRVQLYINLAQLKK